MFRSVTTYHLILLVVEAALLVVAASCDERQKIDALSFFFDGVPAIDPNVVNVGGKYRRIGFLDDEEQQDISQSWYVHEPAANDCQLCHGERSKELFSKEVHLVAPVPELCYGCHAKSVNRTQRTIVAKSVHGPVAVGLCLKCHHQHRSKNKHILKEPVPDLCFGCHDKKDIALIPGHGKRLDVKCPICHEPHASEARMLLKPDWRNEYLNE